MEKLNINYNLEGEKVLARIQQDLLVSISVVEKMFDDSFSEVNVVVAKDKHQYDEILNTCRPPWGVTTHKSGTIYLYNPFLWRRNTTGHNLSDLRPSLIHELVHLFMFANKIKSPTWFEEGLAVLISDENKGNKKRAFEKLMLRYSIPDIINSTPNFKEMKNKLPLMHYLTFYMFLSYIFKTYSKNRTIEFIKSLTDPGDFEIKFEESFKKPLEETWQLCKSTLSEMRLSQKRVRGAK